MKTDEMTLTRGLKNSKVMMKKIVKLLISKVYLLVQEIQLFNR